LLEFSEPQCLVGSQKCSRFRRKGRAVGGDANFTHQARDRHEGTGRPIINTALEQSARRYLPIILAAEHHERRRGARFGRKPKLSEHQRKEGRRRLLVGNSARAIARDFGVLNATVSRPIAPNQLAH
jgi:hypothetical protein